MPRVPKENSAAHATGASASSPEPREASSSGSSGSDADSPGNLSSSTASAKNGASGRGKVATAFAGSKNVPRTFIFNFLDGASYSIWQQSVFQQYVYDFADKSNAVVGYLAGAQGGAQVLTAIVGSVLSDRNKDSRYVLLRVASAAGVLGVSLLGLAITLRHLGFFFAGTMAWGVYAGLNNPNSEALFADSVKSENRPPTYTAKWITQILCYLVGYAVTIALFAHVGNSWTNQEMEDVMYVGFGLHAFAFAMLWTLHDSHKVPAAAPGSSAPATEGDDESGEDGEDRGAGATATSTAASGNGRNNGGGARSAADTTTAAAALLATAGGPSGNNGYGATGVAVGAAAPAKPRTSSAALVATPTAVDITSSIRSQRRAAGGSATRFVPDDAANEDDDDDAARAATSLQHSLNNDAASSRPGGGSRPTALALPPLRHEASSGRRGSSSNGAMAAPLLSDADAGGDAANSRGESPAPPVAHSPWTGASVPLHRREAARTRNGSPTRVHHRRVLAHRAARISAREAARLKAAAEAAYFAEEPSPDAASTYSTATGTPRRHLLFTRRGIPYWVVFGDFLASLAAGMTVRYFPLFFIHYFDVQPIHLTLLFVAATLTASAAAAVVGVIAKKVTRNRVVAAMIFRALGCAAQFYLAYAPGEAANVVPMMAAFVLRMAFMNCTFGLTRSVIMDHVPAPQRARWSAVESLTSFTWAGSAVLGGYIADAHGYRATFGITAAIGTVATMLPAPAAFMVRDAVFASPEEYAAQARVALEAERRAIRARQRSYGDLLLDSTKSEAPRQHDDTNDRFSPDPVQSPSASSR